MTGSTLSIMAMSTKACLGKRPDGPSRATKPPFAPLTWLSHQADWSCYGPFAGGHHLTNLLLHTLNTLLLFLLLRRQTGNTSASWIVAALFGWHPLHVESVAWIAERKDLLSTLCLIGTLWAYTNYAQTRQSQADNPTDGGRARIWRWYGAALLVFAAGLMCKPMLVTLPCLLLLFDYWPLKEELIRSPVSRRGIGSACRGETGLLRSLCRGLHGNGRRPGPGHRRHGGGSILTPIIEYARQLWRIPAPSHLALPAMHLLPPAQRLARGSGLNRGVAPGCHQLGDSALPAGLPVAPRRLALAPRQPGPGHRTRPGRNSSPRRPLHVHPVHRDLRRGRLDRPTPCAPLAPPRRDRPRPGRVRADIVPRY